MKWVFIILVSIVSIFIISETDWYKELRNEPTFVEIDNKNSYSTTSKRDGWDLWIYDSPNYPDEVFYGLESKELCQTEGLARTRNGGRFECGYRCLTFTSTVENITSDGTECEQLCNKSGCRD